MSSDIHIPEDVDLEMVYDPIQFSNWVAFVFSLTLLLNIIPWLVYWCVEFCRGVEKHDSDVEEDVTPSDVENGQENTYSIQPPPQPVASPDKKRRFRLTDAEEALRNLRPTQDIVPRKKRRSRHSDLKTKKRGKKPPSHERRDRVRKDDDFTPRRIHNETQKQEKETFAKNKVSPKHVKAKTNQDRSTMAFGPRKFEIQGQFPSTGEDYLRRLKEKPVEKFATKNVKKREPHGEMRMGPRDHTEGGRGGNNAGGGQEPTITNERFRIRRQVMRTGFNPRERNRIFRQP